MFSNCTPARIVKETYSEKIKTSKVKVTREKAVLFVAVPAIFGYDEKDRVSLWDGDSEDLNVPVGKHEFFVRSNQADRPFKFTFETKENESLCLTIHPESKPIVKFVIPLIYYFSHAFRIEKLESCS
ncbi:MAG: hypothetical protein ACKO47_00730 [Alphaproteobacteria bacterium]